MKTHTFVPLFKNPSIQCLCTSIQALFIFAQRPVGRNPEPHLPDRLLPFVRDGRRGSLFLDVSSLVVFGLRLEVPLLPARSISVALVSVVPMPCSFL